MEAYDFYDYAKYKLHTIYKNIKTRNRVPDGSIMVIFHDLNDHDYLMIVQRDWLLGKLNPTKPGDFLRLSEHIRIEVPNPEECKTFILSTPDKDNIFWIVIECPARIEDCQLITTLLKRSNFYKSSCKMFFPRFLRGHYYTYVSPEIKSFDPLSLLN